MTPPPDHPSDTAPDAGDSTRRRLALSVQLELDRGGFGGGVTASVPKVDLERHRLHPGGCLLHQTYDPQLGWSTSHQDAVDACRAQALRVALSAGPPVTRLDFTVSERILSLWTLVCLGGLTGILLVFFTVETLSNGFGLVLAHLYAVLGLLLSNALHAHPMRQRSVPLLGSSSSHEKRI